MPPHKFLPNSDDIISKVMLDRLGLASISELFSDIPESVRLKRELRLPKALSEVELENLVASKISKNKSAPQYLNFIGGGNWLHHVPSIIDELLGRGEFYTSYTPYQPEISQGMLQGLFEYQSQICALTEMQVANSSLYDWATALGEAGRMAFRVNKRKRLLVGKNVSPERVGVLRTYVSPLGLDIQLVDYDSSGKIMMGDLERKLGNDVAAMYFENPNFFGIIEDDIDRIVELCHSKKTLVIAGVNPITLGLIRPPGSYGTDIAIGDGQPLGLYPNFGGPMMGIFATREEPSLLRQMPGRLIGATLSKDGSRRGYTMVLQTREQHIRREYATSNICTNEALFALAVSIYLASMGPKGIKEIGENIVTKSHYALKRVEEERLDGPFFKGSFFGDLSLRTGIDSSNLSRRLIEFNILGGLPLGRFYADLSRISLFSFSEIHTLTNVEHLISSLKILESGS
ncbi:MAG: aminomethyl-transferring glycine dehydrogenase subunit GcvPA [Nitrososphaerota archaeon]|nr:aminomethyl-transferring glycine dehydrogenase subunit GcvPA [Nitrososphaerota archaeon]